LASKKNRKTISFLFLKNLKKKNFEETFRQPNLLENDELQL